MWELICIGFGIRTSCAAADADHLYAGHTVFRRSGRTRIQTLYETLVAFAFGIVLGVALGVFVGSSRLAYDVTYPLLIGFSAFPGRGGSDLRAVVRRRYGARHPDRDHTLVLPIVVNVATGLRLPEPELEDVCGR